MELNNMSTKKKRKYYKCGKVGHIRRFCKEKKNLVLMESENENLLAQEGS